jgi:hypothetical protein
METSIALSLIRHLIRPAVQFCVRYGITGQEVIEALKREFITEATKEIEQRKEKASVSRLSTITGLNRREVDRLTKESGELDTSKNLIYRVVSTWQQDATFLTSSKKPRVLSYGTKESDFTRLVATVSKDLNAAAVLAELLRVRIVRETTYGLALVAENYIPKGDPNALFSILSKDMKDLCVSVEENTIQAIDPPNLHLRTEYDRIRPEGIAALKAWLLREGHDFHLRARAEMAKFDQDINPDPTFKGQGSRVSLTAFSLVDRKEDKEAEVKAC